MNHIDFILIIIIFLCFAIGWKIRGVYLVFLTVAFFTGIMLANITYVFFAKTFFNSITAASKKFILSYITAFIIFASIVIIIGVVVSKFLDFMNLAVFDKLLGALLLVNIGVIPVYFIFNFFANINIFEFKIAVKKSLLYPFLEKYVLLFLKLPVFKIIKINLLSLFSNKIVI